MSEYLYFFITVISLCFFLSWYNSVYVFTKSIRSNFEATHAIHTCHDVITISFNNKIIKMKKNRLNSPTDHNSINFVICDRNCCSKPLFFFNTINVISFNTTNVIALIHFFLSTYSRATIDFLLNLNTLRFLFYFMQSIDVSKFVSIKINILSLIKKKYQTIQVQNAFRKW